jgi:hypothetical protein
MRVSGRVWERTFARRFGFLSAAARPIPLAPKSWAGKRGSARGVLRVLAGRPRAPRESFVAALRSG